MNENENNKQIMSTLRTQSLIQDLRQIIEQARGHVATTANYALTTMYWNIGERINREVLDNQRAEYGNRLLRRLRNNYKKSMERKDLIKVPSLG